jgi:hypothetical protein
MLLGKSEIGLVNEGGGLKRVPRTLRGDVPRSETPEFGVELVCECLRELIAGHSTQMYDI